MTPIDDDGISAEEKIKQLIASEDQKKNELEDKKKELAKKKRELDELEIRRKKESESTRKQIEDKIEELAQEERQRFEELEEIRKRREQESASLEEQVAAESPGAKPPTNVHRGYGDIVNELLQGKPGFYELTNYNVMNRLEEIAGEAGNRPLTKAEQDFIEVVQYHAEHLQKDDFYKDKEGATYLRKELAEIDFINKRLKDRETGPGDYQV